MARPNRRVSASSSKMDRWTSAETGRMSFDRYARRNVAEGKRTVMAVLLRRSGLSDGEGGGAMQLDKRKQPMLS